jgi:inner membrane protein
MENPSAFDRFNAWIRRSVTLKLITVGILILILLIPSSMITSLIYEREGTRNQAIAEVSDKWGGTQTIGGPVISIPYRTTVKDEQGKVTTQIQYAHFLPENLKITGTVVPEKRYRGIYVVVLYNAKLNITGSFKYPEIASLGIDNQAFILQDAFVSLGISDMKGIKENIKIQWNDTLLAFNPGIATADIFTSGMSVPVRLDGKNFNFSCQINLNGSSDLNFLPFGKENLVSLQSKWDNPSFTGSFLPDNRNVSVEGFTANWKVLHLNRNYPQQGLGSFVRMGSSNGYIPPPSSRDGLDYAPTAVYNGGSGNAADFGVKLLLPIDEYQKTTRSAKYSVMFICLTFLTFFFVEVLNRQRIHPIQYLLVGFAITLFYILLLSISEHLSFDWAYLIGCLTILSLITFYARAIFKSARLTFLVSGVLAILYGFFYSLLQLQDYALLLGSLGLLLILAVIMYLTRNINWYKLNEE